MGPGRGHGFGALDGIFRAGRSWRLTIPRQEAVGVYLDFHGVLKKPGQIVEGIYARKLTGMDQAHEQVPHLCAVLGLIEQGIFPVADGELG